MPAPGAGQSPLCLDLVLGLLVDDVAPSFALLPTDFPLGVSVPLFSNQCTDIESFERAAAASHKTCNSYHDGRGGGVRKSEDRNMALGPALERV